MVRPMIRFRRLRSEQFNDGYLQRARQHLSFELGVAYDLRSELDQLKQEVARLTAELAKQKAISAMAHAAAPRPHAPPCASCGGPAIASHGDVGYRAREPADALARQPAEGSCLEQIVLLVDDNWP